jgi:hypothetical protein
LRGTATVIAQGLQANGARDCIADESMRRNVTAAISDRDFRAAQ